MLYTYGKNGKLEATQSKNKVLYISNFPFCIRVSSKQRTQALWTEGLNNNSVELRAAARMYMHLYVFQKQKWMCMTIHSECLCVYIVEHWELFTFLAVERKTQVMPMKGTYRKKIHAGKEILSRFYIYSINVCDIKHKASCSMREQSCPHTICDDTASLFCKVRKETREIMPRLNLSYPTRSPLHAVKGTVAASKLCSFEQTLRMLLCSISAFNCMLSQWDCFVHAELLGSALERILCENKISNRDTKILLNGGDRLNKKALCFLEPGDQML